MRNWSAIRGVGESTPDQGIRVRRVGCVLVRVGQAGSGLGSAGARSLALEGDQRATLLIAFPNACRASR